MSSPGGREVGRVSVRVLPDTSGFRRDLKRELDAIEKSEKVTIPVDFDVDTARLREQLAQLDNSRVTIPVDLDLDTDGLRAKLEAIDAHSLNIKVGLDIANGELARFEAGLSALGARSPEVNISVNVRGGALAVAELTAIELIVDRLDGRNINFNIDVDTTAALAQVAALEAALVGLGATTVAVNAAGGGLGSGGFSRGLTMLGVALAAAVALAPLLAIAGAAITAAWGAVATSIAVIPAGLALIGVPLALLMLDTERLGKSLKKLTPAFQEFRKAATDAFAAELAPAAENFALNILPKVADGLVRVITTVGSMAREMSTFLATSRGITLLNGMIDNVTRALQNMKVGLGDIGQGFLIMANQAGAFDVLTTAVNTFGAEFKRSVTDLIGDGTMDRAFKGLETTLASLTRGFVQLVDNGIRVFAAAGPGVTKFLDSLTAFFERFNWDALGRSVGNVFAGIGETLDRIPQGTIDGIVAAFERLGAVFRDTNVQSGFASMAAGVQPFLDVLSDVVFEIGHVASIITGFNTVFEGLGMQIATVGRIISGDFMDSFGHMNWGAISDAFAQGEAKVREGNRQLQTAFADGGAQAGAAGQRAIVDMGGVMKSATQEAFLGIGEAATVGSAAGFRAAEEASKGEAGRVGKVVQAELQKIPEQARTALDGLGPAVTQSFTGLSANVTQGMAGMDQAVISGALQLQTAMATGLQGLGLTVQAGFAGLAPFATTGMLSIQTAVTAGVLGIQTAMALGLQGLGLAVQAGFTALAPFATAGMLAIQTAVVAGSLGIQTAMALGLAGLALTVQAGFANLALSATTGMTAIAAAVTAGMVGVQAAMTLGLVGLGVSIQAAFAGLSFNVLFGMAALGQAVTAGFPLIQVAFNAGFLLLVPIVDTGMLQLAAAVTAGMLLVSQAFVDGFNAITTLKIANAFIEMNAAVGRALDSMAQFVAQKLAVIGDAFVVGMGDITNTILTSGQAWVDAIGANLDVMAQQVTIGFETLKASAEAGLVAVNDSIVTAGQVWTDTITTAAAAMDAALNAGMTTMNATARSGLQSVVGTLNSFTGQFRAAGANMGQALADGLNSKVGAVQAAADRLAAAAAAATRAAAGIHSPSRVFMGIGDLMGQGLAIGLEDSKPQLIKAAATLTDALQSEFNRVDTDFAPTGIDKWASALESGVRRSMVETSPQVETVSAGVGGSGGPAVGTIIVNNPVAERASNSIAQRARQLAELGMFSG